MFCFESEPPTRDIDLQDFTVRFVTLGRQCSVTFLDEGLKTALSVEAPRFVPAHLKHIFDTPATTVVLEDFEPPTGKCSAMRIRGEVWLGAHCAFLSAVCLRLPSFLLARSGRFCDHSIASYDAAGSSRLPSQFVQPVAAGPLAASRAYRSR